MADGRKKNGGARKGAGRKPKADEHKTTEIFKTALREIYDLDQDDAAKIEFAKSLMTFTRGQMFVAEHIFGKPKENVDLNVSKRPDLSHLSTDELKNLLGGIE